MGGAGGVGRGSGGKPLNGERDDLHRFTVRVAPGRLGNLSNLVSRRAIGLLFHPAHQFGLGVLGGHAGELLEPASLLAIELLELFFAVAQRFLAAAEITRPLADFLVALLEEIDLPIENRFLLDNAALLALDLLTPATNVQLSGLAKPH